MQSRRLMASMLISSTLLVVEACTSQQQPNLPRGYVPSVLVGSWCGGSNDAPEGHWTYTFGADGTLSAYNPNRPGLTGTAIVNGNTLTIYTTTGQRVTSSISLNGSVLFVDGFSYVPGSC